MPSTKSYRCDKCRELFTHAMFECDGCKALTCSYSCKKQHEYKHEQEESQRVRHFDLLVQASAPPVPIIKARQESPEERYERLALTFNWEYAFNLRYIDHFFQLNAIR